ncbi:MAG TPA: hypothetical protein VFQ54_08500, partial [Thermomicrobiales bacterium]|nr:hypothetical protein [Thermomicrobiales bacterium]
MTISPRSLFRNRRVYGVVVLGLSSFLLVSCGGSSDKDKTPTAAPPTEVVQAAPTEVATIPPAPTSPPSPVAGPSTPGASSPVASPSTIGP